MKIGIFILLITARAMANMALVVYDDSKVPLARFRDKEQEVTIGEHTVVLEQNWGQGGVAGVLWDSAIIISKYIITKELVKDKRVLELGAGLGLPSIIAAKEGASQVIATDQESGLRLLNSNLNTNLSPALLSRVVVEELNWSSPSSSAHLPFDVILGADLVYNKEVFPALHKTLLYFLKPGSICLMASKIRYPKDRKFYTSLARDFDVAQLDYDHKTDVTLFEIRVK